MKGLISLKNIEAAFSMPESGPLYKAAPELIPGARAVKAWSPGNRHGK
jgi:hypothetical protein